MPKGTGARASPGAQAKLSPRPRDTGRTALQPGAAPATPHVGLSPLCQVGETWGKCCQPQALRPLQEHHVSEGRSGWLWCCHPESPQMQLSPLPDVTAFGHGPWGVRRFLPASLCVAALHKDGSLPRTPFPMAVPGSAGATSAASRHHLGVILRRAASLWQGHAAAVACRASLNRQQTSPRGKRDQLQCQG